MLVKRRLFLKIIIYTYILLGFIIFNNKITFAITHIQLKPQLKEIKVKNFKISMPTLSPDHKIIAFVNIAPSKIPSLNEPFPHPVEGILYVFNINENKIEKLTDKIILDDEPFVSWSPDSNFITFGSKGEIWIIDVQNKKDLLIRNPNKNRVKTYPGYYQDYFHSPSWSLEGSIIAVRNVDDIWLYDLKLKVYAKLYSPPEKFRSATDTGDLPSLVWSNDSTKLAFDLNKLVRPPDKIKERYIKGISVIDVKTKKVEPIVGVSENIEYYPVFSTDNNYVAFFSRKNWDSKPMIFINDLKTNKSIEIADCEDECHMLSWSQDGSKLYFTTNKALWIVKIKKLTKPTIEKKIIVKGVSDLSDVFWLPKGDTIYFLKPVEGGKYSFGILKL
ncbi:MAG: DPP IV N-terminal domain-containing protein [Nitrospirota bacterium]